MGRGIGNHALARVIERATAQTQTIQTRLMVGAADDPHEHEAERIAAHIMRMAEPRNQRRIADDEADVLSREDEGESNSLSVVHQITPLMSDKVLQEATPDEDLDDHVDEILNVQGKSDTTGDTRPPLGFAARLHSLRGGGRALSKKERAFFEPRFGVDFSNVRLHEHARADAATRAIRAQAFTLGTDIVLGAGYYTPGTQAGKTLLAHELTHVLQQTLGNTAARRIQRRGRDDRLSARSCRALPPMSVAVPQIRRGGPGVSWQLDNFQCFAPHCRVAENSFAPVIPLADLRRYKRQLRTDADSDAWLIWRIHRYLRRVPAAAKFSQYNTWLSTTLTKAAAAPGARFTSWVTAGATNWLVPSRTILQNWPQLGAIPKISGRNPFSKWAVALHERHHHKTIRAHASIRAGDAYINTLRTALLGNTHMMAPYRQRLRRMQTEQIPARLDAEVTRMNAHHRRLMQRLHGMTGGKAGAVYDRRGMLRASGFAGRGRELSVFPRWRRNPRIMALLTQLDKLERLRRLYNQAEQLLIRELRRRNNAWWRVADKARAGATDDVRAYCLSWRATQKAIEFIDRCCGRHRTRSRSPRTTRGGSSRRRR